MKRRPLDFYGPEDHIEGLDPDEEMREVREDQAAWDLAFAALPWWRRLFNILPK